MLSGKKFLALFLIVHFICFPIYSYQVYADTALPWPEGPSVAAGGAILIDGDTGTVLYEKNSHERFYPASITKIMTALLAIENCDLNDTITFSREAIFSIEPGSSHIALNPGEVLTVENALYGLMLESANEAANGLAEKTSGSMEAFAELMTNRAKELGCNDTNFVNANGLHSENHYTSCYDMAMIAKAAFKNPVFCKIDATRSYQIPPTNLQPETRYLNAGHKMLKPSSPEYYEGVTGGKTGYTTISKNTLVTCAERNGLKLIAVVMNADHTHYSDTRALLDFGFSNFKSMNISESDDRYRLHSDSKLDFFRLDDTSVPLIELNRDDRVTLPSGADFSILTSEIVYRNEPDKPANSLADIHYYYGDMLVGSTKLELKMETTNEFQFATQQESSEFIPLVEEEVIHINPWLAGGAIILAVGGIGFILFRMLNDTPKNRRLRKRRWSNQRKSKLKFK